MHNPVGYRITPPVATLNIHPIANAVSEWDANEIMSLLQTIKNLSCEEMTVEFATCLSGRGDAGVDLQTELESFFGSGVNVILYAREIKFYFNKVH